MSNFIERKAISDLLKGDNFYIPSYQRGYRWTSKQVEQLLRDLFAYANSTHTVAEDGAEGDYYCLQPIVARKVTSDKIIDHLRQAKADVETSDAWEIIDGQQRLTTIFILYKYLMDSLRYSEEDLKVDYGDRRLYHIYYATRKGSADFLYNKSPGMSCGQNCRTARILRTVRSAHGRTGRSAFLGGTLSVRHQWLRYCLF